MKDQKGLEVEVGDNVFFSIKGEIGDCLLDGRGKVVAIENMAHVGGGFRDMAHIWVEGKPITANPYKRSCVEKM